MWRIVCVWIVLVGSEPKGNCTCLGMGVNPNTQLYVNVHIWFMKQMFERCHSETSYSNLHRFIHTDAQLRTTPPNTTTTTCNCKVLRKSSHQRCAVTWLPPLITGLQRQWAQWVQRRSFQMTSEPPPWEKTWQPHWLKGGCRSISSYWIWGRREGDCPHNYITAFQRPFEQHARASDAPHPSFISALGSRMCHDRYGPVGNSGPK